MEISFFSFFMAIIWSSLAILFLHLLHRRRKSQSDVLILLLISLAGLVRLLCPVEFPEIVRILESEVVYAAVYERIFLNTVSILDFPMKWSYLLIGIWILGFLCFFVKWAISYRKSIRKLLKENIIPGAEEQEVLDKIQEQHGGKARAVLWKNPLIDIPMGLGLFHKMILLPDKQIAPENLYYILIHEYTHFLHKDVWIRFVMHIICCIFWWNPFVWLLSKEIAQFLEMRCDAAVTRKMNLTEKETYLKVIMEVVKNLGKKKQEHQALDAVGLAWQNTNHTLVERFQMVVQPKKTQRKEHMVRVACVCLIGVLFFMSYLVQFQPSYPEPEIEGELTPENSYLLDNGDGTYTFIGISKESVLKEKWMIDSLIEQGFTVERERKEE